MTIRSPGLLLVGDRPEELALLRKHLSNQDADILDAPTDQVAWALLQKHDIALVLIDVRLAEMRGLALARRIHASERTCDTPILMMGRSPQDVAQLLEVCEAGAIDCISVPVEPLILNSKVGALLRLSRSRRRLEAEVGRLRAALAACSQTEEELRRERDRYAWMATLPEQTPAPVLRIGRDGRLLYANPSAGLAFADQKLEVGELAPSVLRELAEIAFAAGEVSEVELERGSSCFWLTMSVTDTQVNVYARDVTERRQIEREVLRTSQRLQAMMDAVPIGVSFSDDATCQRVTGNRACLEYFEGKAGDNLSASTDDPTALGRRVHYYHDGRELAGAELPLQRAVSENRQIPAIELEVVLPSGRRSFAEASAAPIRDHDGKVVGGIAVFVDLTDRRRLVEEAQRSAELLKLSHDAILAWRPGRGIEVWNRGAEELYGYAAEEAYSRVTHDLLQTRFPAPFDEVWKELYEHKRWEGELVHTTKDGRRVIVSAKLQLFRADDWGDLVLETTRDITDRKRAEEALRVANLRLAEADRRKNDFLAVLSHELRNPLAPIRNSLYVLERAAPGGDQAVRAQAIIARQVDQLSRLVDDLLDMTRITRNKIQIQRGRLELNELIRRTIEDHRSLFENAEIRVELEAAPSLLYVDGDGNRLAQVVGNLLSNASKFTPPGGRVLVSVGSDARAHEAIIRVADTGIGMTEEMIARLFQPFVQADSLLDRSKGGLGLGLALVKGLVELHGGGIEAKSAGLGQGAEFVVRLPLEFADTSAPSSEHPVPPQRRQRILIIEDNPDAAETLRDVLEFEQHEVVIAYSGLEGLAKAREFDPDVVLCDIGLPGMDGYDVARAFRSDARLRKSFLVALSGYALPEDLQRALTAGFDRHLAKPPSVEKLMDVLRRPDGAQDATAATALVDAPNG